ncbi:MAG: hypothetical protein GVY11_00560 [Gammaproteobacteria bacterium]|jgi:hypothetical protein|nr:hypothetical protein [Gammaproteobacteria bacterium]
MNQGHEDNIYPLHDDADPRAFDIPAEELERIIARASVFQNAAGDGERRHLSEGEVISIGREVGLSQEAVRRALAEYRADALVPPAPEGHPLVASVFGPSFARARRVVRGNARELHREFERRLRGEEQMRPVRMRGTESVWEPDSSWISKLTRAFNVEGRSYELAQLKSISIVTAPASTKETLVTLTADLGNERKEQITGWSIGLAGLLVFVLAPIALFKVSAWLLLPATLGGVALAGWFIKSSLAGKRRRAALLLEGLLDPLDAGR